VFLQRAQPRHAAVSATPVFPLLDQLIEGGPILTVLTASSLVITISALIGGILLRKGDS
jgi:hypothetical protein